MAHTYSHLFGLPTTGLRFFTVYGPWGRPDMALFLFTKAILEGRADRRLQPRPDACATSPTSTTSPKAWCACSTGRRRPIRRSIRRRPDPARSDAPYRVFNIGNNDPVELMSFIEAIEQALGREAKKNFLPLQDGDVPATFADVSELAAWTGFKPATSVPEGVGRFVAWYRGYFGV